MSIAWKTPFSREYVQNTNPDQERQTPYDLTYMWNLLSQLNWQTK